MKLYCYNLAVNSFYLLAKIGGQMYKIYINNIPFLILPLDSPEILEGEVLRLHYPGKRKFLLNVVDQLEKTNRIQGVELRSNDPDEVWEQFQKLFLILPAAGGLVKNPEGECLFIFRRGYWDLPKGKVDEGESFEEAAIREVQEETGLMDVKLKKPLITTWHTYRQKGKRILKPTQWFLMDSSAKALKLQYEEDIEKAEWIPFEDCLADPPQPIYRAILDVIRSAVEE